MPESPLLEPQSLVRRFSSRVRRLKPPVSFENDRPSFACDIVGVRPVSSGSGREFWLRFDGLVALVVGSYPSLHRFGGALR